MKANEYSRVLHTLKNLFPNSTDIKIEVITNSDDIETFSQNIHNHSESRFVVKRDSDKKIYSKFRTPYGMISLTNNGK